MNESKKKSAVLGLGKSGCSAAEFLFQQGYSVVAADDHAEKIQDSPEISALRSKGLTVRQSFSDSDLSGVDFLVLSPGIPPSHSAIAQAEKLGVEIVGEMELACRHLKNRICIGITGTNGKTTVTLLIEHILKSVGLHACAVGNIGIPFTSLLLSQEQIDIFVIEISSYQLDSLQEKCLDYGILLNITPDHLDRYKSFDKYISSKYQITQLIKPTGKCFIKENIPEGPPVNSQIFRFGFDKENFISTDGLTLYSDDEPIAELPSCYQMKKTHDIENIVAAFAVCNQVGVKGKQFTDAVETFRKPPHRIEFTGKKSGVSYYNDSKGTNVDATLRAVESMDGDTLLIVGGVDKGAGYGSWIVPFQEKVRSIYAIGEAAQKIYNELNPFFKIEIVPDLEIAVRMASQNSKPGDNILLSPGCSSFDMFRNYEHRGDEFKRIVTGLIYKE